MQAIRTRFRSGSPALGDREGAVLVVDPHSGRIRAVVNPRLAFEQAFPPGSTMKVFTALTALRSGLIDGESRAQCRGTYRLGDYQVTCSHPRSKTPFNPAQAIGYSCNCYFADLGSRLSPGSFVSTLSLLGFGKRTGVNAGGEAEGTTPGREWNIGDAVGEGKDVTVTMVQLLAAYTALFNGGHLYRPQQGDSQKVAADEQGSLRIDPAHRRTLIAGMRGAVEYGTAAEAGLTTLPLFVFGKTGTSSASNGFHPGGTAGLQDLRRRMAQLSRHPTRLGWVSSYCSSAVGAAIALKSRGRYSRLMRSVPARMRTRAHRRRPDHLRGRCE